MAEKQISRNALQIGCGICQIGEARNLYDLHKALLHEIIRCIVVAGFASEIGKKARRLLSKQRIETSTVTDGDRNCGRIFRTAAHGANPRISGANGK